MEYVSSRGPARRIRHGRRGPGSPTHLAAGAFGGCRPTVKPDEGTRRDDQPAPLKVDMCGKPNPGPADMALAWQVQPVRRRSSGRTG